MVLKFELRLRLYEAVPRTVDFTERLYNKMLSIFKTRVRSMPKAIKTLWFRYFVNIVYDCLIIKFLKSFLLK